MYSRTPRNLVPIKSQTNEKVGPGTYIFCDSFIKKKENCVGFLSSSARKPSFFKKSPTDAIYDTGNIKQKIKGGSSLKSKSKRFVYGKSDTCLTEDDEPKIILPPRKKKLYACRVPFTLNASTPSVPTKIDENGYDIDAYGKIIKIPASTPSYEKAPLKSTLTRGCKWSGRTAKRFPFKADNFPGPGQYDAEFPECSCFPDLEEYREMARRYTYLPRYVEAQEIKATRNAMPGPGYYDIDESGKITSARSKSINPRPFINKTVRFQSAPSKTPSPDTYNICDKIFKQQAFSVKEIPFGVECERRTMSKIPDTPGPGNYRIKSALQEKLQSKINPFCSNPPPFNQTAKRNTCTVAKDLLFTPACTEYDVFPENCNGTNDNMMHVFKSAVDRFPLLSLKDIPVNPASYNVSQAFNKNSTRRSCNTGKVPFNSSAPRGSIFGGKPDHPGPTDYNTKRLDFGKRGTCFSAAPRLKWECSQGPGPGSYNIGHSSLDRAFETHNYMLKKNIMKKKK